MLLRICMGRTLFTTYVTISLLWVVKGRVVVIIASQFIYILEPPLSRVIFQKKWIVILYSLPREILTNFQVKLCLYVFREWGPETLCGKEIPTVIENEGNQIKSSMSYGRQVFSVNTHTLSHVLPHSENTKTSFQWFPS